jgi:hypothetical protein
MSFAPDHFSLLLGAEMVYSGSTDSGDAETGWIVPFLKDYDQEIHFRPDCTWWEKTVECIRAFRKRCDGKMIIYGTHFQGGLDDPAAIKHLPAIAEIEKIKMIQWVPGPGEAATKDWTSLFEQIDDLGLGNLHGGNRDTVKQLWQKYRSRRYLYIHNVYGITCRQEAGD